MGHASGRKGVKSMSRRMCGLAAATIDAVTVPMIDAGTGCHAASLGPAMQPHQRHQERSNG